MAKARRKSGGCTRGRFKLKKMGKGWSTLRKARGHARPKPPKAPAGEDTPQPDAPQPDA